MSVLEAMARNEGFDPWYITAKKTGNVSDSTAFHENLSRNIYEVSSLRNEFPARQNRVLIRDNRERTGNGCKVDSLALTFSNCGDPRASEGTPMKKTARPGEG